MRAENVPVETGISWQPAGQEAEMATRSVEVCLGTESESAGVQSAGQETAMAACSVHVWSGTGSESAGVKTACEEVRPFGWPIEPVSCAGQLS